MSWRTILLGTFFTLFTSLWCCIRPDFSSPRHSKLRILAAKLNIVFWVLIFPEGVLYWSMRQWFEAGSIPKHIFKDRGWTRRHGLFFLMGGFILCDKDGRPLKTLSLRHLWRLAQQKLIDFPLLTSFEIQEQSNLHAVFVLLAFLQGTWFLAQSLSRLTKSSATSQGLPVITQFEAIAAVLVIANWSIFIFAWKKPLDPQLPILIKANLRFYNRSMIGYQHTYESELEQSRSQITERRFRFERPRSEFRPIFKVTPSFLVSTAIWPFQSIFNDIMRFFPPKLYFHAPPEFPDGTLKIPLFYVDNTMSWNIPLLPVVILSMVTSIASFLFVLRSDAASYFPSWRAQLVWHIASITTTSISAFLFCLLILKHFFDFLASLFDSNNSIWNNRLENLSDWFFMTFCCTIVGVLAPFLLARLLLLVTSVVCLKSTPAEVFVARRSWADYIPHLS